MPIIINETTGSEIAEVEFKKAFSIMALDLSSDEEIEIQMAFFEGDKFRPIFRRGRRVRLCCNNNIADFAVPGIYRIIKNNTKKLVAVSYVLL